MENQYSIFDMLPDDDPMKIAYQPKKATDWKWSMAKDYPSKNGLKVFSCFACGGGSTMGYKLAGCEVLGCNEIDPRMNKVYVKNHKPKYNYLMDIRDFNKLDDLPEELFHLDILDGSPPCSTFSMAGQREEAWGVEKKFKEGQKLQTLDDLLFVFIDTVAKLKPKVAIMENVEGLLLGNAFEYVKKIYEKFHKIGYTVRHELLKGEYMGIPQTRHRVVFIATRLNFDLRRIDLSFNYEKVTYGACKDGIGHALGKETHSYYLISHAQPQDKCLADTRVRLGEKASAFQTYYIRDDEMIPTLRGKPDVIDIENKCYISKETIRNSQTFPQDYDFLSNTYSSVGYICGMSVPPIMMKRVVERLIESKIFEIGETKND